VKKIKIAVVGGGPAGMMAAIRAGSLGQEVVLLEKKGSLGSKLLLSGKGRCNLTNAEDLPEFLARFSKNGDFLRDAFKKFFSPELISFFETRGVKLKVERQKRVFPQSDRSSSILEVLKNELVKSGARIIPHSRVTDVVVQDGRVSGALLEDGQKILCDRLILACGGASYSFTGSDGSGAKIAERCGHKVVPLRPGLAALEVKQGYIKKLEGLTLRNIRVRFFSGKNEILSEIGEMIFTSNGISGPLVITLSGRVDDLLSAGRKVFAQIDLKPALSHEQLDARLIREFAANSRKGIKNALKELLPMRLILIFVLEAGIDPLKKCSQVSQKEREKIISMLKGFSLEIAGCRPLEEAMITRGGVSLKQVDPRTMESRLVKGLYFCGEMIDLDADTGGFNLQAAFSTGYLAGESAAKERG